MLTLTEPPFGAALCALNALLRRGTLRVAYTIMEMKADTTMTIRMNQQVKQKAQNIFAELGMDMTTAINVFLRQVIYKNGFPFDVVLPTPNDVTVGAMDDAEGGQDLYGPYDSVAELMDALNDEASVHRPMQKGSCIGDQARL